MYFLCQQYRTLNFANSSNSFSEIKWIYTLNDLWYLWNFTVSKHHIYPTNIIIRSKITSIFISTVISERYSQICAIWDYALFIENLAYMVYKI